MLPNGSALFTIYLRPGLYWFKVLLPCPLPLGYAQFYIGMKAFGWYVPWINQSLVDEDIRVINNYTIQFLFQKWSPGILYYLITSSPVTPWPVWKWAVEALKTMNVTQAMSFGTNNITKFVAPY
ncbi:MAG: ABC transporter substrate-binding protein, partial [Caldivirga sp.]